MSEPDPLPIVRAFLETQSTLSLATVGTNCEPAVAPLFYVSDDRLNLYWLSAAHVKHSLNVAGNSRAAVAIYPSVWQWMDIVGVQIEGEVEIITDERIREQIMTRYLRKFTLPAEFDAAISTSTLYMLRPDWIRWVDNSVKFGHKAEIRF